MPGYECARVYLALDVKAASNIYAIYGTEQSPLQLATTDGSPFFQGKAGLGVDIGGVNPVLYEHFPSLKFDSWLTLGPDDGSDKGKMLHTGFPLPFKGSSLTVTSGALKSIDHFDIPGHYVPDDPSNKTSRLNSYLPLQEYENKCVAAAMNWFLRTL